jgi:phospholipase C
MFSRLFLVATSIVCISMLGGCVGLAPLPPGQFQISVATAGGGTGTVTSNPSGISCPGTCSANFQNSGPVTLTAAPSTGFTFTGWSGACTPANTTCTFAAGATGAATATFGASLQSINHIIFLAQENRSFDSYFGAMRAYWAANGIADQQFDGLPQFNPPANPALAPAVPGCDPVTSTPTVCHVNPAGGEVGPPVTSFHFNTMCVENPSPSWGESHGDWNASDAVSPTPTLDGFVRTAANDARQLTTNGVPTPFFDVNGVRSMGYYDGGDLNYYYAMATAFSTSDSWFAPVMTRTPPNREYLIAGTSQGHAYQLGPTSPLISSQTIFEMLQNANPPISWRIYVPTIGTPCSSASPNTPSNVVCLIRFSYLHDFTFGATIKNNPSAYTQNIVPVSQFATDAQGGTLPQVAQVEPASAAGQDEHPSDADVNPACCTIQAGANFASSLINSVMCAGGSTNPCAPGPSWQDSVFVFTFDEFGGFYDHMAPQPSVSPDGIPPTDLFPNDPCFGNPTAGPTCDFSYTGYRVPLIVVSPFAKKNFVSHQVRDYTAVLKLIETRFNLSSLTARDAAQVDMADPTTGFFDFTNVPWKVPPTSIPAQIVLGQSRCYLDHLP